MNQPLQLQIYLEYITGESKTHKSFHRPIFTNDGGILIKTDHGVVRYEKKDLMRLRTTTVFKDL